MKIAIIIGAIILFIVLCVIGFFLIRRALYNMIDRRISIPVSVYPESYVKGFVLVLMNLYMIYKHSEMCVAYDSLI